MSSARASSGVSRSPSFDRRHSTSSAVRAYSFRISHSTSRAVSVPPKSRPRSRASCAAPSPLLVYELLADDSFLGAFFALLCYVGADDRRLFGDAALACGAVQALCKYALTSQARCAQALPLLCTLLQAPQGAAEAVRTSVLLCLGDLAVRFPNAFEPWTEQLYARLRDASAAIRFNALVILTHLVLNDLVKLKSHAFLVALALQDDDAPFGAD